MKKKGKCNILLEMTAKLACYKILQMHVCGIEVGIGIAMYRPNYNMWCVK